MIGFYGHLNRLVEFASTKKNPLILEFGVQQALSTKKFIDFAEKNNASVLSIDIEEYGRVSNSSKWKFLRSNDLDINFILKKFPEIEKEGIDLLFIDSNHEDFHVLELLLKYFKHIKKNGAIFIDDVDNYPLRLKKDYRNAIVYDLTLEAIKNFYYNNSKICSLKIFYDDKENGLAMIHKKSELGDEPNRITKIWNYNPFLKIIYPFLKKLKMLLRKYFKNEKI